MTVSFTFTVPEPPPATTTESPVTAAPIVSTSVPASPATLRRTLEPPATVPSSVITSAAVSVTSSSATTVPAAVTIRSTELVPTSEPTSTASAIVTLPPLETSVTEPPASSESPMLTLAPLNEPSVASTTSPPALVVKAPEAVAVNASAVTTALMSTVEPVDSRLTRPVEVTAWSTVIAPPETSVTLVGAFARSAPPIAPDRSSVVNASTARPNRPVTGPIATSAPVDSTDNALPSNTEVLSRSIVPAAVTVWFRIVCAAVISRLPSAVCSPTSLFSVTEPVSAAITSACAPLIVPRTITSPSVPPSSVVIVTSPAKTTASLIVTSPPSVVVTSSVNVVVPPKPFTRRSPATAAVLENSVSIAVTVNALSAVVPPTAPVNVVVPAIELTSSVFVSSTASLTVPMNVTSP